MTIVFPTTQKQLQNIIQLLDQVNQEPYDHDWAVQFINKNVPLPSFMEETPEEWDTEVETEWLFKGQLMRYLQIYDSYLQNPNDFVNAWKFVDHHPALWYKTRNQWVTSSLVETLTVEVARTKNGNPVIMVEGGTSVRPNRTSHYHDLRLDVNAETYEKAIVGFAARLHKFFNLDGSKRVNVKYQKTELEKTLEERILQFIKENADI